MDILNGRLVLTRSFQGGGDVIYVGVATRHEDFILLSGASNVVRYEDVGFAGLAGSPAHAVRIRPVSGPSGEVLLPLAAIIDIVICDVDVWADHLGVTRS